MLRRAVARPVALLALALLVTGSALSAKIRMAAQSAEQTQRLEGEAILALADRALAGRPVPSDFRAAWQNAFLKAQRGTFVPFTLTIDVSELRRPAVLVYVRAVPRGARDARGTRRNGSREREGAGSRRADDFPVDAIFPAELQPDADRRARVSRGFTLAAGAYDVFVVIRERADPADPKRTVKAAVLQEPLEVPNFWSGGLTTSSIILADRLDVLARPLAQEELAERPYVVGQNDITPALDGRFGTHEELIVVFLVYNPTVTADGKFDLQVEYHFYLRGAGPGKGGADAAHPPERGGERYLNHTDPQRFNPSVLGAQFDAAVHPVLAGQGVPLRGFQEGDYRLGIKVTDLLSGTSILRDVYFTVGS